MSCCALFSGSKMFDSCYCVLGGYGSHFSSRNCHQFVVAISIKTKLNRVVSKTGWFFFFLFLMHPWTLKSYCFKQYTLTTVGCLQLRCVNRMDQGHPWHNLLEFSIVTPGVNLAQYFGISSKGHSCSLPWLQKVRSKSFPFYFPFDGHIKSYYTVGTYLTGVSVGFLYRQSFHPWTSINNSLHHSFSHSI